MKGTAISFFNLNITFYDKFFLRVMVGCFCLDLNSSEKEGFILQFHGGKTEPPTIARSPGFSGRPVDNQLLPCYILL